VGDNNYGSISVGHADWDAILGARYGQFMKKRSGQANPYPNQTSSVQRFFPTVGNHDRDVGVAGHLDYFHTDPGHPAGRLPPGVHDGTQSYYDVELPIEGGGSVRIFAMDSESFASSAASQADQSDWLHDGLTGSTATWNFVLLHRPPYSSGIYQSSSLFQLPYQQWGADAVIAGHDHDYERLRVTDSSQTEMLYFVNGLGGAETRPFGAHAPGSEFRYNETAGAMRIVVTEEVAQFEFLAVEFDTDGTDGGVLVDSFTLVRSNVLTADFNGDGFVDEVDLNIWKSAHGDSDSADADGDGDSDGADFLAWQRQRSNIQPFAPTATHSTSAVPEPATRACVLWSTAGLAIVSWRPRRRPARDAA
jgi:hypothetical protein